MLHLTSIAEGWRPLAFVGAERAVAGCGVGVAQTNGAVCGPAITGPPIGWLVITSRAAWLFEVLATRRLSPFTRPVTRPRILPPARTANLLLMSLPFSWTRSELASF